MVQSQKHFEGFEDHTLLKHAILRRYLLRWAMKLTRGRRAHPTLVFVDAFAGAGCDTNGRPGSPLIAANARLALGQHPTPARLDLFLIESDATRFAHMRDAVQQRLSSDIAGVRFEPGDYRALLPEMASAIAGRPSLAFLDPLGVKGLDASALPVLLAGPQSEVFVLVSGVAGARLHGLLRADASSRRDALVRARNELSLFPEIQREAEARAERELEEYQEVLDANQPAAREILLTALGSEQAVEELAKTPPRQRADAFVRRFGATLRRAGARHVLAIPMRGADRRYRYTLLHGSQSAAAVSTMKEAVAEGLNDTTLDDGMRERIRADLATPLGPLADQIGTALKGQTLYWSAESRDGTSLRRLLLEQSALFPFQWAELGQELRRRNWLKRGPDRKLRVTLP